MTIETILPYLLSASIAALMLAMPHLSRGSTWFAVTVAADFPASAIGRLLLRRYQFITFASLLLALALITPMWWLLDAERTGVAANFLPPLIVLIGAFGGFMHCRDRTLVYSRDEHADRSVDLAPPDRLVDVVPRPLWLHALPYLFLALPALWLRLHWAQIPDPVVMPLGFDAGGVERTRDVITVFALPLVMVATLVLMHLIMPLGLLIRRLPGHQSRVRSINRMLLWMMLPVAVTAGWNSLAVLYGPHWTTGPAGIVINTVAGLTVLVIPVAMLLMRGIARPGRPDQGDRSPDRCWKLGMFYFNPADPALWVEKRWGIGYTINFACHSAWLIVGGILALSAAIIVWAFSI